MKETPTITKEGMARRASGTMTRRVFLGTSAFVLATGIAVGANGFTEPFRVERCHVRVPVRDLPPSLAGYRIGQISDLHYPRNMTLDFLRDAVRAVDSMKPDVLVITGDLVDRKGPPNASRSLAGLFDDVNAPDGILAVLGNHDHWYDAEAVRRDLRDNTPVRLIDHTHVMISRGDAELAIGGVGDLWTDKVELQRTFGDVPPDVPRVLLSHNPDVAELKAHDGIRVDLQLSGHTHGGEVNLPFVGPPAVPSRHGRKYVRGLVQGPAWPVYINRGLCSPRFIRFACRPEVTCIELVAA